MWRNVPDMLDVDGGDFARQPNAQCIVGVYRESLAAKLVQRDTQLVWTGIALRPWPEVSEEISAGDTLATLCNEVHAEREAGVSAWCDGRYGGTDQALPEHMQDYQITLRWRTVEQ